MSHTGFKCGRATTCQRSCTSLDGSINTGLASRAIANYKLREDQLASFGAGKSTCASSDSAYGFTCNITQQLRRVHLFKKLAESNACNPLTASISGTFFDQL